jgi:hypothetical protein
VRHGFGSPRKELLRKGILSQRSSDEKYDSMDGKSRGYTWTSCSTSNVPETETGKKFIHVISDICLVHHIIYIRNCWLSFLFRSSSINRYMVTRLLVRGSTTIMAEQIDHIR